MLDEIVLMVDFLAKGTETSLVIELMVLTVIGCIFGVSGHLRKGDHFYCLFSYIYNLMLLKDIN